MASWFARDDRVVDPEQIDMRATEEFSPRYKGLDLWPDAEVLAAFWDGQMAAVAAVRPALPAIAAAAAAVAARLGEGGGRLVYGGAGTSGLLAIQDGMEMNSTFGWPPERLLLLMAGGDQARLQITGGDEDDAQSAEQAVEDHRIGPADAVIAVAASGTTPFTVALLRAARAAGALTVGIANCADTPLLQSAEQPILLDSGPEVIAGSTRLNAGTAQKATLGMLSSLAMTRLGHVVDGLMVSLVADNEKLKGRGVRIVAEVAAVEPALAEASLERGQGRVKDAILIARGAAEAQARDLLAASGGNLRVAMERLNLAS